MVTPPSRQFRNPVVSKWTSILDEGAVKMSGGGGEVGVGGASVRIQEGVRADVSLMA